MHRVFNWRIFLRMVCEGFQEEKNRINLASSHDAIYITFFKIFLRIITYYDIEKVHAIL